MAEKTTIKKDTAALKLVNIVKTYGEGENAVQALKGVNISFRKNEFVSVLGPSGCGKTTMLNIIGGLDRYTSGDLVINGVSTKEYKDKDWDTYRNNSIGFVFQNYNLIPHQTVLSNVELALTLSGVSKAERHKRAKQVLKRVGLKDQANKKPNQLSGGQMQRVAIARALVNDPEIILADEPTGALDTETSVQVLDLLKEVARDRLVIMVTHNPALAEKYSTRIITLLDGEKTGDTDEFIETDGEIVDEKIGELPEKKEKGKAAMKLGTAFLLSFSNLLTKKGRTTLTSIAGSIGIIGIALVLAVSTGFSGYVSRLQADTLSSYPVTMSEATIDLEDFQKLTTREITSELLAQRLEKTVYTKELFGDLSGMLLNNNLSDQYIEYVKDYADKENDKAERSDVGWAYSLQFDYGFDVNDYLFADLNFLGMQFTMPIEQLVRYLERVFDEGVTNSNMNITSEFVREYIPTTSEIPNSRTLIESQYELLDGGKWPEKEDELLLVVNKYNEIPDITLAILGYRSINGANQEDYSVDFGGNETMSFEEVKKKQFYYMKNDNRFAQAADLNWYDKTFVNSSYIAENYGYNLDEFGLGFKPDMTLKITGIARIKDGVSSGVLEPGIAYTSAFKEKILNDNKIVYNDDGEIDETNSPKINVAAAKAGKNPLKVYSWYLTLDANGNPNWNSSDRFMAISYTMLKNKPKEYREAMQNLLKDLTLSYDCTVKSLAGRDVINKISVYSAGYQEKKDLKAHLDAWNDDHEKDQVHYSDSTEMLFSALNAMVDGVKIVLIAFTAISLVVSSIMIGIITYVSVVERTREIGVLRALGARKKDVSRIFNAETFIIGLLAGIIGVGISYLLTIPINLIVGIFIENAGAIAALKITDALLLVVISFVLTLFAGIIPSRVAAKKDPVVALRSE